MARNQAIVIGINQYEFLQSLRYAKQDALLMEQFLRQEAGFEEVFFFSDDSQPRNGKSTRPFRNNLLRVLREIFETRFMQDGDNFWFFFSGHGIRHADRDYLMPSDGDPKDIENTAIPINHVTGRLRRCGADNVVLMLDACRNLATRSGEGIGNQTADKVRQTGVVSIFSCSPSQYSYEIEAIQQGAFTKALLDGLGIQGRCATVERLNQYLEHRVPEIVSQHHPNAQQTPYTIAEPVTKSHLILIPQYATVGDKQALKMDAYRAESKQDYRLAKQCWLRVLAVPPPDPDAIDGIERLARMSVTPPPPVQPDSSPAPSTRSAALLSSTFEFEVVTLEVQTSGLFGRNTELVQRSRPAKAEHFRETLGSNIFLDMVSIPGSSFQMGAVKDEAGASSDEYPQHSVTIAPFYMGKFAITQVQWQAIATLPKIDHDLNPDPSNFKGANRPVEQISWFEAVEFCERLNRFVEGRLTQKTRNSYRLASEAEWEYACRAGTTTPFHFGETILTDLANYNGNDTYGSGKKGQYRKKTTDVGSFSPNAFGLYDMHGNVWEWCSDRWHDSYDRAPSDGSVWEAGDSGYRLLRGGSWLNYPLGCRSADRYRYTPEIRDDFIGFRVVCLLPRTL
ncbi:MAG: SUMF1/EgtB/PvdO family nonheme iron enzyme [Phormidesmis sp. CAN_BIN44]|nr:SUMF1/EgtB/PvdO family nonheme iron enzyme [Phormidesmis sp. CAN_BIN44]